MQIRYPLSEAELDSALNNAWIDAEQKFVYVPLPRLTLGDDLPPVQFPYGVSVEDARDAILTNVIPKIRAGLIGTPIKPTHAASLTIH